MIPNEIKIDIEEIIIEAKIGNISVEDAVNRILQLKNSIDVICSCKTKNYGYGHAKCFDCGKLKITNL
jgi:hypothetical protein